MALIVTLFFSDNTRIGPGVNLQLLNNGVEIKTALTDSQGQVTFDVDSSTLTQPAVKLAAQQIPPAH